MIIDVIIPEKEPMQTRKPWQNLFKTFRDHGHILNFGYSGNADLYLTNSGLRTLELVKNFKQRRPAPVISLVVGDTLRSRRMYTGYLGELKLWIQLMRLVDCVDKWIPVSSNLDWWFVKLMIPAHKIIAPIPTPINVDDYIDLKKIHDDFIIGYVGRWSLEKGSSLLKQLIVENSDLTFWIASDAPKQELEFENVHLFGWLSYPEMLEFYRGINCVIVPSEFESIGWSTVESLLMKKPVISRRSARPEPINSFYKEYLVENHSDWRQYFIEIRAGGILNKYYRPVIDHYFGLENGIKILGVIENVS
jgi:glycosyltransferase involved in cell wall biosynthesis